MRGSERRQSARRRERILFYLVCLLLILPPTFHQLFKLIHLSKDSFVAKHKAEPLTSKVQSIQYPTDGL